MRTAVFTIASRNYFAHVDVLMESLEATNPDYERYVVCVDEMDASFTALPRNYELIKLDALGLPQLRKMAFRYTILEFNTAVKPWGFKKLLEDHDRVIYLDPDIVAYGKLVEVDRALDEGASFVFTPHFTHLWSADGKKPDETDILRAGTYNLGFLAVSKCADVSEMLTWWQRKLERLCTVDIPSGIFVDQKWMDLVPGLYDGVRIVRDDGYNVAYWNLSHRSVVSDGAGYRVNGRPLAFFHFSGFNSHRPDVLSKHQDRFSISDLGEGAALFADYTRRLLARERREYVEADYAFGRFADGALVLDCERWAYRSDPMLEEACGENPFALGVQQRRNLLRSSAVEIWKMRPDVHRVFRVPGRDFLEWARNEFSIEEDLETLLPEVYRDKATLTGEYDCQRSFSEWLKSSKTFLPPRVYALARSFWRFMGGRRR